MTLEIEPTVLAEIKEQAKTWLDYEAQIHERVLKESAGMSLTCRNARP